MRRSRLSARVFCFCLLVALLSACATAPDAVPDAQRVVLDVELETAQGEPLSLHAYAGSPILLFFFTTYDSASQLALGPLVEQLRARPDVQAVGVALQPAPGELLNLYGRTLAIPFPLAHEPAGTLLAGRSALGGMGAVPQYVLLDGQGRVTRRHQGVLVGEALQDFLQP